jgi:hypothetical protein
MVAGLAGSRACDGTDAYLIFVRLTAWIALLARSSAAKIPLPHRGTRQSPGSQ